MLPRPATQQCDEHLRLPDTDQDISILYDNSPKHTSMTSYESPARLKDDDCSSTKLASVHLRILSLNVCGLTAKKKFPELYDVISKIDIACLLETKLDDIDQVDLAGFTCFMKNRRGFRYRSGGVALLVRNELLRHIKIVENVDFTSRIDANLLKYYRLVQHPVSDNGLFFEISVPCKEKSQTLVGAAVYVPPENSVYTNRLAFQEIEETLANWDSEYVLLFGDFNGRTGIIPDFINSDDNGVDDNALTATTTDLMDTFGINKSRYSRDKGVNNFGHSLLELCISQGLLIVNGRAGKDDNVGNFTCKGLSVVDYAIAPPPLTFFHI